MEFKELNTAQVITTRDFPVHSAEVLQWYFEIYKSGESDDLPPVPLMHIDCVAPHFEEVESTLLQEFLRRNPQVGYFLLNGSHRTTAANLAKHRIKSMLLRTRKDIQEAGQIKFRGQIYQHGLLDDVMGNIKDLVKHFSGTDKFETVQQKTDRMVNERVLAEHMIAHYQKKPVNNDS